MEKREVTGIYKITNKINGRVYIGCSTDIEKRFTQHKRDLIKRKHHNILLQRSWNKYGESAFEFEILEVVNGSRELLLDREKYWGEYYKVNDKKHGFNIITCGKESRTIFVHNKDTKRKMRLSSKLRSFCKRLLKDDVSKEDIKILAIQFMNDNEYTDDYFENIDHYIDRFIDDNKTRSGVFNINENNGNRFDFSRSVTLKRGDVNLISSVNNKKCRYVFYVLYVLSLYLESEKFLVTYKFITIHSGVANLKLVSKALSDLREDGYIDYTCEKQRLIITDIKKNHTGVDVTTIKPNTRLIDHPTLDNLYIL